MYMYKTRIPMEDGQTIVNNQQEEITAKYIKMVDECL